MSLVPLSAAMPIVNLTNSKIGVALFPAAKLTLNFLSIPCETEIGAEIGATRVLDRLEIGRNRCHTSFRLLNRSRNFCLVLAAVLNIRRRFPDIHS